MADVLSRVVSCFLFLDLSLSLAPSFCDRFSNCDAPSRYSQYASILVPSSIVFSEALPKLHLSRVHPAPFRLLSQISHFSSFTLPARTKHTRSANSSSGSSFVLLFLFFPLDFLYFSVHLSPSHLISPPPTVVIHSFAILSSRLPWPSRAEHEAIGSRLIVSNRLVSSKTHVSSRVY